MKQKRINTVSQALHHFPYLRDKIKTNMKNKKGQSKEDVIKELKETLHWFNDDSKFPDSGIDSSYIPDPFSVINMFEAFNGTASPQTRHYLCGIRSKDINAFVEAMGKRGYEVYKRGVDECIAYLVNSIPLSNHHL